MKKNIAWLLTFGLVLSSVLYAQEKIPADNIFCLNNKTALLMDLQSYGDTVYQAFLALDEANDDGIIPIYINKYLQDKLDSTLRLELRGFCSGEFRENGSHYKHLHIFPIGKDEIILTIYSAYSDCRFGIVRIKDKKITDCRVYSLKNLGAYESQEYAYNGKDRIYLAFNGSPDFKTSGWDTYLLAFDLNCRLVNAVTVMTDKNDELTGLAALGNYVYYQLSTGSWANQCIVQLDKNLTVKRTIANYYKGSDIRGWDLYTYKDYLIIETFISNDNSNYYARYSPALEFKGGIKIQSRESDKYMTLFHEDFSEEGITFLTERIDLSKNWWGNDIDDFNYMTFKIDWKGNKLYEYDFKEVDNLSISFSKQIGEKFLCTGNYNYEASGIGKVLYNFVLENKDKDNKWIASSICNKDFVNQPEDSNLAQAYNELNKEWQDKLIIKKLDIPEIESKLISYPVELEYLNCRPQDPELLRKLPLLPFSER